MKTNQQNQQPEFFYDVTFDNDKNHLDKKEVKMIFDAIQREDSSKEMISIKRSQTIENISFLSDLESKALCLRQNAQILQSLIREACDAKEREEREYIQALYNISHFVDDYIAKKGKKIGDKIFNALEYREG